MTDNELEIAEQTLWGYLPKLVVLANQSSEHQQTTAKITAQGYLLAGSLAGHRDDLNAREHYCEHPTRLVCSSATSSPPLQAILGLSICTPLWYTITSTSGVFRSMPIWYRPIIPS